MRVSDFKGDVDKWVEHAKGIFANVASVPALAAKIGDSREPLDTLLELWLWYSHWGPNHASFDPDEKDVEELKELPEFRVLTNVLATWCDDSRRFDPTPLLVAVDALQRIHDFSPVSGMLVCPQGEAYQPIWDQLWQRWNDSRDLAHVLIRRIRLQLDLLPGTPEEKGRMEFNRTFDKIRDEWKDIMAVGLLFHSGGKITNKAISDHLGYSDQKALNRLKVFSFWGLKPPSAGESDEEAYDDKDKPRIDRIMRWLGREWERMKRQEANKLGEKRQRAQSRKKSRKQRF